MRTTIDSAGRLVIPKELRDRLGFVPGEVELSAVGTSLWVSPISGEGLVEEDGLLVIPAAGRRISAETVQALRDADQR